MSNSFNMKRENGVVWLSAPGLEQDGVRHFFSTRIGGESEGVYASLNLGVYTGDEPDAVVENFIMMGMASDMSMDELVYLNQVHSDVIYVVEDATLEDVAGSDGDALITSMKNVAIGVFTADCVPILLYDVKNKVIAAVHAGWKGTSAGIVKKTVQTMIDKMGAAPTDINAAIGPCIGSCCFEIGDEIAELFVSKEAVDGRWHVDLEKENLNQLMESGLSKEHIDVSGQCTNCEQELFFSYRRDEPATGRMGAFIQLV